MFKKSTIAAFFTLMCSTCCVYAMFSGSVDENNLDKVISCHTTRPTGSAYQPEGTASYHPTGSAYQPEGTASSHPTGSAYQPEGTGYSQ